MRLLRLPDDTGVPAALAAAATLGTMAAGLPVLAHGIESSLERLAPLSSGAFTAPAGNPKAQTPPRQRDTLQLHSRFSSGEPAQSATVRLVPPDGEAIEVGQTDAEGQLRFQLPRQAGADWELQVDAGPGHRDYLELSDGLIDGAATGPVPAVRRSPLARKRDQRVQLLVGLTGAGLGAAGLLRVSRRRR